tara:strand:+ start:2273 stop:2497 length:225 start_codon:yes stop_codon:yes gene_type:complete
MIEDVSSSGNKYKISLKDVKTEFPISKESLRNWGIHFGKLLVDYNTDQLSGRLKPLPDYEIMYIIYDDDISLAS